MNWVFSSLGFDFITVFGNAKQDAVLETVQIVYSYYTKWGIQKYKNFGCIAHNMCMLKLKKMKGLKPEKTNLKDNLMTHTIMLNSWRFGKELVDSGVSTIFTITLDIDKGGDWDSLLNMHTGNGLGFTSVLE